MYSNIRNVSIWWHLNRPPRHERECEKSEHAPFTTQETTIGFSSISARSGNDPLLQRMAILCYR